MCLDTGKIAKLPGHAIVYVFLAQWLPLAVLILVTLLMSMQYSIKMSMFVSGTAESDSVVISITVSGNNYSQHNSDTLSAPIHPEEENTVAVNTSPRLTPPSLCLSMSSTYPAQTSTPYEETSSVAVDSPPTSHTTMSELYLSVNRSHITGSLPHLGGNTSA